MEANGFFPSSASPHLCSETEKEELKTHLASMALVLLYLTLATVDTVSIKPNKLQFFHYDEFTLSCDSDWMIRRNTSTKTSQPCKGGFGDPRQSSCLLKDTYSSDSGQYWCESKGGKERSSLLNITVTAGAVILESPASPVTEGDKVTLHCFYKERYDPKPTSDFSASFFINGSFIGTEPDGKMILRSVKKSDEGFYKCKHPTKGESAESLLVVTGGNKMDPATHDTVSIKPNKLQFFHYDEFTLSCDSDWMIRRNTSTKTSQPCKGGFGDPRQSSCLLKDTYSSDSGQYWCESKGGKERSSLLNITVTAGAVILESPASPVTEGDKVTLRCFYKDRYDHKPTSDFSASFFKNVFFIGTEPEGKMILRSVKKSDEGFYKCKHPTKGESAESLLVVTGGNKMDSVQTTPKTLQLVPPDPAAPMSFNMLMLVILVFILYTIIIIVCVYAYQRYTKARAMAESVIYDHLVIIDN
ncbi:Sialoadhesin [Channa argus]|uniref:Sialoadhesin n=1 Tax=Channa argus TaxID=215402 RepID=A0A6G1Q6H2_CHAAH|nr:Sialoadhesin [Channa argus]